MEQMIRSDLTPSFEDAALYGPRFLPQRLRPIDDLAISHNAKQLLARGGCRLIEDVLLWRRNADGCETPAEMLNAIDESLAFMGLFRADPIPRRDWELYDARLRGATFGSLATDFHMTPGGARVVYQRVRQTLEAEARIGARADANSDISVRDLPLPTRAKFVLQRVNILTLRNLLTAPIETLLEVGGVGTATLEAIKDVQAFYRRDLPVYRE
jgi:hypothetical protein